MKSDAISDQLLLEMIFDFSFSHTRETADSGQQTADSRQQTADSRQQTADSRQQTADSRQQTADNRQQTTDNRGAFIFHFKLQVLVNSREGWHCSVTRGAIYRD